MNSYYVLMSSSQEMDYKVEKTEYPLNLSSSETAEAVKNLTNDIKELINSNLQKGINNLFN